MNAEYRYHIFSILLIIVIGFSIYINSLLPHILADHCKNFNSKLIHISTDCVFSGKIDGAAIRSQ